jgi:hypothetical protein
MRYAAWLTSPHDAEDLLSEAVLCVCDPDTGRPWRPERGTFQQHVRFVLHDIARARRDSARARREIPIDDTGAARVPDPGASAEEALDDDRALARLRGLGGQLRARLAVGGRAAQVFDLACEGEADTPARIALRLGCDVREIYEAIRRLKREGDRILYEEERAEAARRRNLREAERETVETP